MNRRPAPADYWLNLHVTDHRRWRRFKGTILGILIGTALIGVGGLEGTEPGPNEPLAWWCLAAAVVIVIRWDRA